MSNAADTPSKLQQANLDLLYASRRLKEAQEELAAAEREHSAAGDAVEKLEDKNDG